MGLCKKIRFYLKFYLGELLWYFVKDRVELRIGWFSTDHVADFHSPISDERRSHLQKKYPERYF